MEKIKPAQRVGLIFRRVIENHNIDVKKNTGRCVGGSGTDLSSLKWEFNANLIYLFSGANNL